MQGYPFYFSIKIQNGDLSRDELGELLNGRKCLIPQYNRFYPGEFMKKDGNFFLFKDSDEIKEVSFDKLTEILVKVSDKCFHEKIIEKI
jgi:hypothetical protein